MKLGEAITRFERALIGQGSSKNTVKTYMAHLKDLAEAIGDKEVEEITSGDLNEFLYSHRLKSNGDQKSQRTINGVKIALKSLFRFLELKENPTQRIKIKRVRIERDYISQEEVRELLTAVPVVRDQTILAVSCLLGLRREETAGLTVGDLRGQKSLRILGKGGMERDIPINNTARMQLEKFFQWKEKHGESLDPSAPLFVSRKGNKLSANAIYNLVRKWTLKVLHKELYPHALRHTFATMLVNKNVNLATVQRLMGHAHLAMTEPYIHISNELRERAVEELDLE